MQIGHVVIAGLPQSWLFARVKSTAAVFRFIATTRRDGEFLVHAAHPSQHVGVIDYKKSGWRSTSYGWKEGCGLVRAGSIAADVFLCWRLDGVERYARHERQIRSRATI
jgi:hypothetical protein